MFFYGILAIVMMLLIMTLYVTMFTYYACCRSESHCSCCHQSVEPEPVMHVSQNDQKQQIEMAIIFVTITFLFCIAEFPHVLLSMNWINVDWDVAPYVVNIFCYIQSSIR